MSSETSEQILGTLMIEVGAGLRSLRSANTDTGLNELLAIMGVEDLAQEKLRQAIELFDPVCQAAADLATALDAYIETEDEGLGEFVDLAIAVGALIECVCTLDLSGIGINDLPSEFGERLVTVLLIRHLLERAPVLVHVLIVLGVIEAADSGNGNPDGQGLYDYQSDFSLTDFEINEPRLRLDNLSVLLSDPVQWANNVYGWLGESKPFSAEMLLKRLGRLVCAMGYSAGFVDVSDNAGNGETAELRIPIVRDGSILERYTEIGIAIQGENGDIDDETGRIGFIPYATGDVETEIELGEEWELVIRTGTELSSGIAYEIRPGETSHIDHGSGFESDSNVYTSVSFALRQKQGAVEPMLLFKSLGGFGIEVSGWSLALRLESTGEGIDLGTEFGASSTTLFLATEDADAFVKSLVGSDSRIDFSWTIGWSDVKGVYFQGSSGLDVTFNLHCELGPLNMESIRLTIEAKTTESERAFIAVGLSPSFSVNLGPLIVAVKELPVKARLQLPSGVSGMALDGPALGFPSGAGLSLTAGLTGGGFLEFDDTNERYAGILALKLGEIGITAIGLITTKLPDGSKGFSMLVNIGINFNPPIQLSMGFTLSGVGGLIGVNRTMVIDVLQEGIKKGTLDSILFPDPDWVIPNANRVISDLRSVFFPTKDRFVIGPMLKIGYGTPNFITGEIGIFMELPDPVRIVLLGQVEMSLPEPSVQVIGVNIDILGVLDIQKRELSFQAAINASSLMAFALVGDCAFLLRWGQKPELALALGGFHPRFTPPAPTGIFADLRRLGVTIYYGPFVVLGCRGYLALTPNSLQFGGRVDVFIGISQLNLGISGFLSFDALIYFDPFSFNVAIAGGVAVSVRDFSLANVRVNFILSGPTPWNIHGKGRVKVLFFDIAVRFHITWGQQGEALEAIDPWPKVRDALSQATSWGSRLPEGTASVVALRQTKAGADDDDTIVVHPAGMLEIRQTVAPLDLRLSKLGNAPVKTHDMVCIDRIVAGSDDELELTPVEEYFARGQFEDLTDAQQISTPAFEHMKAGVMVAGSTRIQSHGAVESAALDYESILIDSEFVTQLPRPAVVEWSVAGRLVAGAAPARARKQGAARYANTKPPLVTVEDEPSVVVDAATLEPVDLNETIGISTRPFSRIAADQALADWVAAWRISPHSVIVTTASTAQPAEIRRSA